MRLAITTLIVGIVALAATFGGPQFLSGMLGLARTDAFATANRESGGWLSIFYFLGMPFFVIAALVILGLAVGVALFVWTRVSSAVGVSDTGTIRDRHGIRGSMDRGDT